MDIWEGRNEDSASGGLSWTGLRIWHRYTSPHEVAGSSAVMECLRWHNVLGFRPALWRDIVVVSLNTARH